MYPKYYAYHENKFDTNEIKKDSSNAPLSNTKKHYPQLFIKRSGSLLLWNGNHCTCHTLSVMLKFRIVINVGFHITELLFYL